MENDKNDIIQSMRITFRNDCFISFPSNELIIYYNNNKILIKKRNWKKTHQIVTELTYQN